MKKKWKIVLVILMILIGVFFLTPLRYYNPPLEGAGGATANIEQSKKFGVFLFEYRVQDNPIQLRNGRTLHINEAWVEKGWTYTNFSNKVNFMKPSLFNICLSIDEKDVEDYGNDYSKNDEGWWIGIDYKKHFGQEEPGNFGISWLQTNIPANTESFIIYHGDTFARKKIDTLGILTLNCPEITGHILSELT